MKVADEGYHSQDGVRGELCGYMSVEGQDTHELVADRELQLVVSMRLWNNQGIGEGVQAGRLISPF